MTFSPRFAALALFVAAAATTLCGCGLRRHLAPRPDYDLPLGFSGTYRFNLVLAGEVPAGPTDKEALARMDRGPAAAPAGPFAAPLSIAPAGTAAPPERGRYSAVPPGLAAPSDQGPASDRGAAPVENIAEPLPAPEPVRSDATAPPPDDPAPIEGPLAMRRRL
ncbi:hypothetical protein [Alienimonas sp. DA493]|uniref:hypothetical protein n=1 Tax=Alienimonas sp. DA493 TaxID=3373605 RepID=UPI003753F098